MSEVCFFKNAKNSFTLSDQVFDVACYPWRIVRFGSYKFVRIDLSAALSIVSEMSCILWSLLDRLWKARCRQFFSVFIIICQFLIPNFSLKDICGYFPCAPFCV